MEIVTGLYHGSSISVADVMASEFYRIKVDSIRQHCEAEGVPMFSTAQIWSGFGKFELLDHHKTALLLAAAGF